MRMWIDQELGWQSDSQGVQNTTEGDLGEGGVDLQMAKYNQLQKEGDEDRVWLEVAALETMEAGAMGGPCV